MEYTHHFDRTFDVGAGALLRIANRRGELVVRAEDRNDIHFTATLRLEADSADEAEERFRAIDLPMDQRDHTVEIGPPEFTEQETIRIFGFTIPAGWRSPRLDMAVAVPRDCRLHTEHRSGLTRVEGLRADLRLNGRTGRTQVRDVEGHVEVEARTGTVEVRSIRGALRVETRTGRVEIEDVTGDATLSTRTGAVLARGVSGELTCTTRTGAVRAVDCDGPFHLSTRTGTVEYRGRVAHAGSIDVTTGRITLAVTRDSAFFIDASTERGSVQSELSVDDVRQPEEGAPTVRLRATTGSIRVVPA